MLTFIPRTSTITLMRRCLVIAVIFGPRFLSSRMRRTAEKRCRVHYSPRGRAGVGDGISPLGEERAEAYKDYFLNFTVDSKPREPAVIFAAKDSKKSHRPRLTVNFAKAANLKIDTRFGNKQSADLAADLRANQQGKVILICWRHPYMPALLGHWEQTPNLSAEWQMAR